MVQWGPNQVYPIPGNANATPAPAPAFGAAPAPAFGSTFGSSTPTFGRPASGGLFGAAPAPAAGGGLFGSAPAPAAGGLFGSAPSPAGGGLFGSAPATPTQPPAPPAQPAQVAIQAGIAAEARQEEAKMQSTLHQMFETYTGTVRAAGKKSSPLITIVYQNMDSQQLAWYYGNLKSGGAEIVIPPRPPQVSQHDWLKAVVNNPDPHTLIPIALIGAEQLMARVGWQQDMASRFAENSASLTSAADDLQRRSVRYRQDLKDAENMHQHLKSKLLKIMTKVEVLRGMNLPLQKGEMELVQRLQKLIPHLQQAPPQVPAQLQLSRVEIQDENGLQELLTKQRQTIVSLTETVQRDQRDLKLLQERVAKN